VDEPTGTPPPVAVAPTPPAPAPAPARGPRERVEQAVGAAVDQTVDGLGAVVDRAATRVPPAVRPRLRGWLHAGAVPVVLALGILLVALADPGRDRWACAVYAVSAVVLFATSAVYHRGRWSPRVKDILKRVDHANIFVIIAGSYTPFAVMLLPPSRARLLLAVVWGGAAVGVVFRVVFPYAPRWLVVPAYVLLGWVAVWFLPAFLAAGGVAVLVLLATGGLLYTLGGVVYGTKRPDPYPTWFGFHEVFHALVLAAFFCQYAAALLVALKV